MGDGKRLALMDWLVPWEDNRVMMDEKWQKCNDVMNVKQVPMSSLMNVEVMHTLLIMGTIENYE